MFRKERVRSKVTPRKVGVGLKRRRELSKRRLGWRLAWWGSTEKKEASHLLGLKGRPPVLKSALQSRQSSLCGLHCSRDRGGGGQMAEKRKRDGYFSAVRVKVIGKVFPVSILKIEGWVMLVGAKDWRKRDDQ